MNGDHGNYGHVIPQCLVKVNQCGCSTRVLCLYWRGGYHVPLVPVVPAGGDGGHPESPSYALLAPDNPRAGESHPVTLRGPVTRRVSRPGADSESPGRMLRLPTEGPESLLPSSERRSSRTHTPPLHHLHGYGHAPATASPPLRMVGCDNPTACQPVPSVWSGGVVGVVATGGGGKGKRRGGGPITTLGTAFRAPIH